MYYKADRETSYFHGLSCSEILQMSKKGKTERKHANLETGRNWRGESLKKFSRYMEHAKVCRIMFFGGYAELTVGCRPCLLKGWIMLLTG